MSTYERVAFENSFGEGTETLTALSGRRQGKSLLFSPFYNGYIVISCLMDSYPVKVRHYEENETQPVQ